MCNFFTSQGYDEHCVSLGLVKYRGIPRCDTLGRLHRDAASSSSDRPVLAITFHPHNIPIKNIIMRNFHIIQSDTEHKDIFHAPPLVAYRMDTKLRGLLVHSRLLSSPTNNFSPGTHPCYVVNPHARYADMSQLSPQLEGLKANSQFAVILPANLQMSSMPSSVDCVATGPSCYMWGRRFGPLP